tara:strand:- start:3064 stop:4227 length:1164 start_codon:yes stop_codon:yes gene_type:complete
MKLATPMVFSYVAFMATMTTALTSGFGQNPTSLALFCRSIDSEISDSQVRQIENLVSSSLAQNGINVIQSDLLVEPAGNWAKSSKIEGGYDGFLNALGETLSTIKDSVENEPEDPREKLLGVSSVTNLAETLGADLLMVLSVDSYSHEQRRFEGNSVMPTAFVNHFHRLGMSYRIVSRSKSVLGDSVMEEISWRESKTFSRDTQSIIDELMRSSAKKIAGKVVATKKSLSEISTSVESTQLSLRATVRLPGGAKLLLPTIVDNRVVMNDAKLNGEVQVDGIVVGNLNEGLSVSSGLHQVSVSIPGYEEWSRFLNIKGPMELAINMEMTPDAYENWKATIEELQKIGRKTLLTDAEMEILRAKAEALEDADIDYKIRLNGDVKQSFGL